MEGPRLSAPPSDLELARLFLNEFFVFNKSVSSAAVML